MPLSHLTSLSSASQSLSSWRWRSSPQIKSDWTFQFWSKIVVNCPAFVGRVLLFFTTFLSPGAFIIPFLVMLLVVGMPLLLLELALGQKLRVGAARAWYKVTNLTFYWIVHCCETLSLNQYIQVHPALGGIGYGSTVVAGLVGCYYNVIIAWCIFYLWSSMNVSRMLAQCTQIETKLKQKLIHFDMDMDIFPSKTEELNHLVYTVQMIS